MGAYTLTGADLLSMLGVPANGSQTAPDDNLLIKISGLAPFTVATFTTTKNAFEFSIVPSTIPEPSTWAMLALGFAGLGYAAFRRSAKGRAVAI
jgi:PEP-CTERM motif